LCCCYSWPLKRNSTEWASTTTPAKATRVSCMTQLNQACFRRCPWICQRYCDRHTDHAGRGSVWQGLTLADESLAGVQQDVTTLHYHSFDSKVFPYVFSVTHFIVHHPVRHNADRVTTGDINCCSSR
jgi:hypothetical protein